jgi:ABC-2 type transport system permease protein
MSAGSILSESVTMTGRELRHSLTYPALLFSALSVPIVMMLLFVYVLGNPLESGLGEAAGRYVDYLTPGILVMTVAAGTAAVAINVCTDMTEGIIDRFRTMPIARSAVLAGHVTSSVLRTTASLAVVTAMAFVVGFRPDASLAAWSGVIGVLVAFAFALAWISVALGLGAATPAAANGATLPVQFLLPFLSSTFVPIDTMPAGLRWFAEHQPFTQVADSVRALLAGEPAGSTVLAALAWSAGLTIVGYWRALVLFRRGSRVVR